MQSQYAKESRTKYPKSVKPPTDKWVLKPGNNNKKLGFHITSKYWKGKKLFYLTLEERKTCPTTCHHWDDCYGNNMPFAIRYQPGKELQYKIAHEINMLMDKYPQGIVIRLHVLGDFYSVEYVQFWAALLETYPKLCIFGYSARYHDLIGTEIYKLNETFPDRCVIRFSANKPFVPVANIRYAAEESYKGETFVCPEQTKKVDSCAACGLCWTTDKTVKFLSH
jgi:hypothetical protein